MLVRLAGQGLNPFRNSNITPYDKLIYDMDTKHGTVNR